MGAANGGTTSNRMGVANSSTMTTTVEWVPPTAVQRQLNGYGQQRYNDD